MSAIGGGGVLQALLFGNVTAAVGAAIGGVLTGKQRTASGETDEKYAKRSAAGAQTGIAGITIAEKAFRGAAQAAETLNNSFLTTAQKQIALAEEFLPGFATMRKFFNAIDGTTDAMQRSQVAMERSIEKIQAYHQSKMLVTKTFGEEAKAYGAEVGAGYFASNQTRERFGDRSTYRGEIETENEQRRMAGADAITRAQGNRAGAREHLTLLQEHQAKLLANDTKFRDQAKISEGMADSWKARRDTGDTGKIALLGHENAINAAKKDQARLESNSARLAENTNAIKEAGVRLGQTEVEIEKAKTEAKKQHLATEQAAEQRMASGAQRLGGMTFIQRRMAAAQYHQARQFGIESLTPEGRSLLGQIAPDEARKMQERVGEQEVKNLGLAGGDQFGDFARNDLQGQRALVNSIKAEVKVDVAFDEVKLAAALRSALQEFNAEIRRIAKQTAADVVVEKETERQKGRGA